MRRRRLARGRGGGCPCCAGGGARVTTRRRLEGGSAPLPTRPLSRGGRPEPAQSRAHRREPEPIHTSNCREAEVGEPAALQRADDAAHGARVAQPVGVGLHDERAWADSDIARLVILWRYGGVYFDTDVLLLRPITPLLGLEFATEFSCDHVQADFNNAIMRFHARSPAATALCEAAKAKWPRLRQWVFGPDVLRSAYGSPAWRALFGGAPPFEALPWCFFHGLWCRGAIPEGAVVRDAPWEPALVRAAFGLHMHGMQRGPVFNASILAASDRAAHAALAALRAPGLPQLFPAGGGAKDGWRKAGGA